MEGQKQANRETQEWLISTPKHIALYKALGWPAPDFSHVGLLVDAAGQKLSKRNHDVDVSSYRSRGILPSALNNWLVLLGWGMPQGSSRNSELFPEMEELIKKVSILLPTQASLRFSVSGASPEGTRVPLYEGDDG